MFSENSNGKKLEKNETVVGNSWDICSMDDPRVSGVNVVLYGDAVNPIF